MKPSPKIILWLLLAAVVALHAAIAVWLLRPTGLAGTFFAAHFFAGQTTPTLRPAGWQKNGRQKNHAPGLLSTAHPAEADNTMHVSRGNACGGIPLARHACAPLTRRSVPLCSRGFSVFSHGQAITAVLPAQAADLRKICSVSQLSTLSSQLRGVAPRLHA